MADYLYRYKLADGRVYIGRDLGANNPYKRAEDHMFNALACAFEVWHPLFHIWEASPTIGGGIVQSSAQFMEQDWGTLLRNKWVKNNQSKQDGWMNLVTTIEPEYAKQEFREQFETQILNQLIWQEQIDSKANIAKKEKYNRKQKKEKDKVNIYHKQNDFFKGKIKGIKEEEQKYHHLGTQSLVLKDSSNTIEEFYMFFEKEFDSQQKFRTDWKDIFQINSWSVKIFDKIDNFWNFQYKNMSLNIIDLIDSSVNHGNEKKNNLQGVKLAEFLLIGLSLSTPQGLAETLNRDIGDYSGPFNYLVNKYNIETALNTLNQTTLKKEEQSIIMATLQDKKYTSNFIAELTPLIAEKGNNKIHINSTKNKPSKEEEIEATIDINNNAFPIKTILYQWMNSHTAENFWPTEDTNNMLKQCFKYSFVLNLASTSNLIEHSIRYMKNFEE